MMSIVLDRFLGEKKDYISAGYARKLAIPLIGLSFVGWIVYVAGFGKLVEAFKDVDPDFDPAKETSLYSYWAASVVGPVVYILAVIHALLWKQPSAVVGSITAVLSMMYITALSYGLVLAGILIREPRVDAGTHYNLLFAGGFLAALGWTGVLALWPWYKTDINCSGYSGV